MLRVTILPDISLCISSVPIHVEWNVTSTANISTLQCKRGKIVLNNTVQKGAAFNCTIDQPGTYQFIANFSNKVSNKTDKFTYTIKKRKSIYHFNTQYDIGTSTDYQYLRYLYLSYMSTCAM